MIIIPSLTLKDAEIVRGTVEKRCFLTLNGLQTLDTFTAIETILFPVIDPTLVYKYDGISILPNDTRIEIALLKEERYHVWTAGEWLASDLGQSATYYSVEQIREYLPDWCGPIQIELNFPSEIQFQELEIGYEVRADLEDWLLKFGIADRLGFPVELSRVTFCHDGSTVALPQEYLPETISEVIIQPLGGKCLPATLDNNCHGVTLEEPIEPGAVQLHYKIQPKIEYIERDYQASQLPSVTIEKIQERGRDVPRRSSSLYGKGQGIITDLHHYTLDLIVQITTIANTIEDARAIARQYIGSIQKTGFIEVPPFALIIGAITEGNLQENPEDSQEAMLPSCSFILKLAKVPFNN